MQYLKNIARKKGNKSRGNTLLNILRKAETNVTLACGSNSGKTKGTAIAASIFESNVYVVSDEALPPNLPVITAAAVAVGHIRHTIAA